MNMKLKLNQTRTYDSAGFRKRAACLCFRSECESEVLLVTSSRHRDLWVVPGGGVEPGEEAETAAVREVNEEAGVIGKVDRLIGTFENIERNTRTFVYALIVERLQDVYDDAGKFGRLRKWFSLDEAIKQLSVHKPVQQKYIDRLCEDEIHQIKASKCCRISSGSIFPTTDPKFNHNCLTQNQLSNQSSTQCSEFEEGSHAVNESNSNKDTLISKKHGYKEKL